MVKYKNILQNATRKKTATAATGGGPPVAALTPAEDLETADASSLWDLKEERQLILSVPMIHSLMLKGGDCQTIQDGTGG
ncbi:hypothetical protein SRHO_G00033680 [Serrasalmus rhombeus]